MGKVLLTLFYHPSEIHATEISQKLHEVKLNGLIIPYTFSSPSDVTPDKHLKLKAAEYNCDHILIVHSDNIEPLNYAVLAYSRDKEVYRPVLKQLRNKFVDGTYGFRGLNTAPLKWI